jgi:predicted Zn finger-like uncharacterized protein
MADKITCCPHCNTSFRITDAQLETAKGAVRCGSCLNVFKARDHLAEPVSAEQTLADQLPTDQPESNLQNTTTANQFADISIPDIDWDEPIDTDEPSATDLELELEPESESESESESGTQPKPLYENKFTLHEPSIIERSELPNETDDNLISDDMNNSVQTTIRNDISDEFIHSTGGAEAKGAMFDRVIKARALPETEDSDESWAEDLLNKTEDESLDEQAFRTDGDSPHDNDFLDHIFADASPITDVHSNPNKHEIINGIGHDPVEMEWHDKQSPWPRRAMWGTLCGIMLVALAAQIGWLKYETLSRIEPYRGIYQLVCPTLGCQVPTIQDITQIKAYNLVIRSHPKASNALAIDSILLNKAPFSQPFPKLMLLFSSLNGSTIAQRSFSPSEYLGGELAGSTIMPSQQPIHIALEVIDPGPAAVNYQVVILAD